MLGFSRDIEPKGYISLYRYISVDLVIYLYIYLSEKEREREYKILAHEILEAEKSQDRQSARWRPGRAGV